MIDTVITVLWGCAESEAGDTGSGKFVITVVWRCAEPEGGDTGRVPQWQVSCPGGHRCGSPGPGHQRGGAGGAV